MKDCVHFTRRPLALVLSLSLVMGACADAFTGPSDPSWRGSRSLLVAAGSDADRAARAVAFAMRDKSIRKQVHRAMRASRVNEHKLVLQDYVAGGEGAKLLSAAATALNVTPESLNGTMANLPTLDFYAPFKKHRLEWKASSDVYVAITFDPDAPTLTAYGTDGKIVTLRQDQGVPEVPLIILHPAEPKLARNAPQANTPGDVIQDPTDGNVGTSYVASGQIPGPAFLMIEPGGGGGGGSPPPPAPGT